MSAPYIIYAGNAFKLIVIFFFSQEQEYTASEIKETGEYSVAVDDQAPSKGDIEAFADPPQSSSQETNQSSPAKMTDARSDQTFPFK